MFSLSMAKALGGVSVGVRIYKTEVIFLYH